MEGIPGVIAQLLGVLSAINRIGKDALAGTESLRLRGLARRLAQPISWIREPDRKTSAVPQASGRISSAPDRTDRNS